MSTFPKLEHVFNCFIQSPGNNLEIVKAKTLTINVVSLYTQTKKIVTINLQFTINLLKSKSLQYSISTNFNGLTETRVIH